jgi:hypothetical protein
MNAAAAAGYARGDSQLSRNASRLVSAQGIRRASQCSMLSGNLTKHNRLCYEVSVNVCCETLRK